MNVTVFRDANSWQSVSFCAINIDINCIEIARLASDIVGFYPGKIACNVESYASSIGSV